MIVNRGQILMIQALRSGPGISKGEVIFENKLLCGANELSNIKGT